MQFFYTISLLAATAFAAPQVSSLAARGEEGMAPSTSGTTCGNGLKNACCNTSSMGSTGGILSEIPISLCEIPVLAVAVSCLGNNVAACCPTGEENDNAVNVNALNCVAQV